MADASRQLEIRAAEPPGKLTAARRGLRRAQHLLIPEDVTHGGSLHGYHSSPLLQLTVYLKSDNPKRFDTDLQGVILRRGIYTR